MKKYHLYLWLIALVGLITSCSQDETDALQTATDANRVTLTASLPADFVQPQPKSRALPAAPDKRKLRCILEIWDTEATPALKVRQEISPDAGATQIDFSFELTTTGTYKALLWADYILATATPSPTEIAGLTGVEHYGDKFYTTTNGLKAVEITATAPQHTEEWDAFCASAEFTKGGTALAIPKVTLTRPFMKLTIAEKNAERFASCKMVTATYNTPSKFDVATGTVIGTRSRTINASDGWLDKGTDITIGGQTCKTLICLYLFADATDGTMGDIVLKFTATDDTKTLPEVTIPAGIPVKRNHRVNAAGNLIGEPSSDAVIMTVDIDSKWTEPDEEHDIISVWDGKYPASADEAKAWMGTETSGAGETDGRNHVFTITAARQLAALHVLVENRAELSSANTNQEYKYATYKLANDIDLGNVSWTSIGFNGSGWETFPGTFDGQSHTISGFNGSGARTVLGLFAGLADGGVIRNVMVKGNIMSSYNDSYPIQIGGIASQIANATIAFCSFEGTVGASNNSAGLYIAGICGKTATTNGGNIISCFANITPTVPSGNIFQGGILGYKDDNTQVQGCTWYYNSSATPEEGIEACYKGWTSSNDGEYKNASYSDASGLSNRLNDMNSYNASYEYEWAVENGTLKLQPKK